LGQTQALLPFAGLGLGCTVSPGSTKNPPIRELADVPHSRVHVPRPRPIPSPSATPIPIPTSTLHLPVPLATQPWPHSHAHPVRRLHGHPRTLVIYHVKVCNTATTALQPLGRHRIHASRRAGCDLLSLKVCGLSVEAHAC